jgi:hypothetical protein
MDSNYNETWTGLDNIEPFDIALWPNPVNDILNYNSKEIIELILIHDSRGKLIWSEKVNSKEGRINLTPISKGIYFTSFIKREKISINKFVKF